VLAIQTSARSSPAPASSQLSPTGQSAVVFSGSGGSAAAQPVQLRDPAELVQRATSESLRGVSDWGLNMRVVDLVNNSPDKADYILQSLMPRLLSKDHAVGLTALAVSSSTHNRAGLGAVNHSLHCTAHRFVVLMRRVTGAMLRVVCVLSCAVLSAPRVSGEELPVHSPARRPPSRVGCDSAAAASPHSRSRAQASLHS